MNQIDKVLAERGSRYGDFSHHAKLAQDLQKVMRSAGEKIEGINWQSLSAVQRQALTVIADKIARILSGDPNYDDNWIDIQGYAKLAQDRLPRKGEVNVEINATRNQGHSLEGLVGWGNPIGYPEPEREGPVPPAVCGSAGCSC